MNTYEPYLNQTIAFTALNGATVDTGTMVAKLYYEDGTLLGTITGTTSDNKTFSFVVSGSYLVSAGTYRLKLTYTVSGNTINYPIPFLIARPYSTNVDQIKTAVGYNASYVENVLDFDKALQASRMIIDAFCGQSFQIVFNQTRTFDGNDRKNLHMVNRLDRFTAVTMDAVDITTQVEFDPRSNFWIRCLTPALDAVQQGTVSKFTKNTTIEVTGDWGYQEVPYNVQLAGDILIQDLYDDVRREKQTYAINKIWQNTNRLEFFDNGLSTTGNQDADMLLLDNVLWIMDYI